MAGERSRRPYDGARRREQAQRTRRRTLQAARSMFLAGGYAGTTMAAIAAAAGVSVETLYTNWHGKAGIVEALIRESLRGEEDAPPLEQSAAIKAIQEEISPRRAFTLYGRLLSEIQPALAPMLKLLRDAASSDARLAGILEQHKQDRLEAMGRFAEHLSARGSLAAGIGVERARDILWTLNSWEMYELLVGERGWSHEQYAGWVTSTLCDSLLTREGR